MMRRATLGLLLPLILNSCAGDRAALQAAAETQGRIEAGVNLAPLPADCEHQEPHAVETLGADILSMLKLERAALDRANARVKRCAQFQKSQVEAFKNDG